MKSTDTLPDQPPTKRYPEAKRPRLITARPKASRRCIWRAIERAEDRLAGLAMAAVAIDKGQS